MYKLSYLTEAVFNGTVYLCSIDAFFIGNESRFINHSGSKANFGSKILVTDGNVKIAFYSICDTYRGDEFLYDYQSTNSQYEKHGSKD